MYNRYDNDVHPRETVLDAVSSIIDHNDSLQDHIKFLSSVSMFFIVLKRYNMYLSHSDIKPVISYPEMNSFLQKNPFSHNVLHRNLF